jgi:hypothetical protein
MEMRKLSIRGMVKEFAVLLQDVIYQHRVHSVPCLPLKMQRIQHIAHERDKPDGLQAIAPIHWG